MAYSGSGVVDYSRRLLKTPEQYLFFPVFFTGALAILILHSFSVPQAVVTAFPVALMIFYCAYALWSGRYRFREDRAGDDLYYLGFLFTLVSLGYSLYAFGRLHAIDRIVSNFGIALSTTIVGLAMRVWLYQLRGDVLEEPELQARIDLAESANRLKVQLSSCIEDMNGFRLQLAQSLTEMIEGAGSKVAAAVQKALDEVREKASGVASAADQALGSLPGHLLNVNQAAARLSLELEHLWQRVENIQAPPDLIQRELTPAIEILSEYARNVEKMNQADQDRASELATSLRTLNSLSEQIQGHFERVAQSAGPLGERIENTGERLDVLNDKVNTASESLNAALETLARTAADADAEIRSTRSNRRALEEELGLIRNELTPLARTLSRQGKAAEQRTQAEEERTRRLIETFNVLGNAAERIREQAEQIARSADRVLGLGERLAPLGNNLEALSAALADATGRLMSGARETSENLDRLAADSRANLAAARSNREALETEVAKSQEMVNKVHDALVSMTSLIVERLSNSGH